MAIERRQTAGVEHDRAETFVPDRWRQPVPGNLLIFASPFPIETPTGWIASDGSGHLFHRIADGTETGRVMYRGRPDERMSITEWDAATLVPGETQP